MPLVVNREYLPSDLYFLRNITIEPSIPTTIKDIGNWRSILPPSVMSAIWTI